MTDDIDEYDKQLNKLLDDANKALEQVQKLKGVDRSEKLNLVADLLERANLAYRSFKVEMVELSKEDKKVYDLKLKDHKARIDKGQADLKWAKQESDHAALMQGAGGDLRTDHMTQKEIIQAAGQIQDQSIDSLARSKQMVASAQAIGSDTAATLREQTEQLKRIDKGIDEVESNLKLADKQMRAFMRRMMTDKMIMCLLCLAVFGVVAVIIWSAVDSKSKTNTPDEFTPQV
eukprot:TRINITY_DN1983_c1_g1_i1.p1 TRINITY_DN1983_c1_g1~~TRINITY_DN1983_c1_g1_i1.p1  ORF type:complete len:232 (-),score=73.50 TRINITY_DN1983_c1_g1_i1:48-743(-)